MKLKSQDKKWLLKKRMMEMEIMNFHDVGKNKVKDCGNEQLKKKTGAGIEVKKLTAQLLDELKNKWRRIN